MGQHGFRRRTLRILKQWTVALNQEYCDQGNGRNRGTTVQLAPDDHVKPLARRKKIRYEELAPKLDSNTSTADNAFTAGTVAMTWNPPTRGAEWAPCVEQAVQRAELPPGTDAAEVVRAVSAPLYYRLLISGDPVDAAAADRAAEAAVAAARAGVYAPASGPN
ncbi:TetR-like C-terminal domain-containing protein [Micromonospora sp. NPDC005305]|uniref:TetR-like C-terminal domain-containing protein n=1 Tax=Micromonospora sp. NPDC005305 TaxID=3156875 RepID=UPI0033A03910